MARFLVTGIAGFIGSHIGYTLLSAGHEVVGLDNLNTGFQENIDLLNAHQKKDAFRFIHGDIRDLECCRSACQSIDFVSHQAALGSVPLSIEKPLLYQDNNVTGTLNMLIAARDQKVKRFIFASSSSVYGNTPVLPKVETMMPNPLSPYAVSKLAGEYYCSTFYRAYGLPTIMLRYFNIFGPRQNANSQYSAVIPKFVTALLQKTPLIIYGDGEQTRDFTYVDNVVRANINSCLTATEESFGKVINIGCGKRISINQLALSIQQLLGSTLPIQYEQARIGDVKDSLAAIEAADIYLNYTNSLTPLESGLTKTIGWYKER